MSEIVLAAYPFVLQTLNQVRNSHESNRICKLDKLSCQAFIRIRTFIDSQHHRIRTFIDSQHHDFAIEVT
ncbi:MAG: hypothetical protein MUD03_05040 [Pirellula sp.]|nr:hypothetical protein [Pirellula sp.]